MQKHAPSTYRAFNPATTTLTQRKEEEKKSVSEKIYKSGR
jgi:hypothetical protein